MASTSNAALAAAVVDLLAVNAKAASDNADKDQTIADLKAQVAKPNTALADEESAEDAITAQIRAVVPAADPSAPS